MRLTLIAIISVLVATASALLSNIIANKLQPHIEHRIRLIVILFSVLVGVAAVLAVAAVYAPSSSDKPLVAERPPIFDNLKIISVKTVEDSQTQIQEIGTQGVISVYWEVILSNVGESNLSVTSYDVKQVGQDFPAVMYSGMDHGLHTFDEGKPKALDLPLELTAGNSRKVFISLGLLMTPESTGLVKEKFASGPAPTLKTIWHFLFTKGMDFYGNMVKPLPGGAGYTWPELGQIREQVFAVTFKTARGAAVGELLSWYKHGGGMDMRRHQ